MRPSNRSASPAHLVYDIGSGGRLISGILFATMVITPVVYLAQRAGELRDLPALAVRNPLAGTVVFLGAALVAWCIVLGIWIPIRNLVFPTKTQGSFGGFSTQRDAKGKPYIEIEVATSRIRARYNPVLAEALGSLSIGERIEVASGARGFVTRIQRG